MLQVIVASSSPAKLDAARLAFAKALPDSEIVITGLAVPSGVAEQPLSDAETYRGARQRALAAQALAPEATLWIGMEGGVEFTQWQASACMTFAWIQVLGAQFDNASRSASLTLPNAVASALKDGEALGPAIDRLFAHAPQGGGALGILTNQKITRRSLYADTLLLALSPWLQSELYSQ